jgi:DNA-binding MarR family transcriptional regulator
MRKPNTKDQPALKITHADLEPGDESASCARIAAACACYNLRRAARAVTRLYDRILAPSGLKATQFSVLMAASRRGPVPMGKLAEATVTERTTLTRNLALLEARGLIRFEEGDDRRQRNVGITPEGLAVLKQALPLWEQAQEQVTAGLGEERLGRILKDMADMAALPGQANQDGPAGRAHKRSDA